MQKKKKSTIRRIGFAILRILFALYILSFVLCCREEKTENTLTKKYMDINIDYWAYIKPGCLPSEENIRIIEEYQNQFESRTGITLNSVIKKSEYGKETVFLKNILKSIENKNIPDLVYTDSDYIINTLKNREVLPGIKDVIKTNADYLFNSFPSAFWEYKESVGEDNFIPMHTYTLRFDYGFWIIEKDFLKKHMLTITNRSDLIKAISLCSNPENYDIKNWYRDGYDFAYIIKQDEENNTFEYLLSLFNLELMDRKRLLFDHSEKLWMLINKLDEEKSKIINNILSLNYITMHASYENITRIPWSIIHIPYNFSLYPVADYQLEKIKQYFNSDKYIFVHDIDLVDYLPSEKISKCLLLEINENSIDSLKALDTLIQSDIPQNIILFNGKKDKNLISQITLHEINNILYHDITKLKYDIRRSYSCFINKEYIPLYDFYNEEIVDKYNVFIDKIKTDLNYNAYAAYKSLFIKKKLLTFKIVKIKEETYEYEDWSKHVDEFDKEKVINIINRKNIQINNENLLVSLKKELQDRTNLFLKLYFSEQ
jgi:hypothetical protein